MSAYIPPNQHQVVHDNACVAYHHKRGPRYVGPCITMNDSGTGIGLVGRPHVSFRQPLRSIKGVFRISSVDDSFTVIIGGDDVYESTQGGSPNCGYHCFVKTQPVLSIGVWKKPDSDDSHFRFDVPLPSSFQESISEGTRVQFEVEFNREGDKPIFTFTVAELNEDGIPSPINCSSLKVYVPADVIDGRAQQTNRSFCQNSEKGRLLFLERLELDGEDFTGELETLTLPNALQKPPRMGLADLTANFNLAAPPSLQSANEVFRADFRGGMQFKTSL
mmetsp:Transcript_7514/g.12624  ORF Transcript_7514/g.12624 Transcript_7514/m.12624 type:complete len:276 (-) Transcript_7514:471-1298(-)